MKYVPKWVNGVWVVFYTWAMKHVVVCRDAVEARERAKELNHG